MARRSSEPDLTKNPGTRRLVARARELGLTVRFYDSARPAVYELSDGVKTVLCCGDHTGINCGRHGVSGWLAKDKRVTKRLLALTGVPTPRGDAVRTFAAADRIRRRFGRVIVKPTDSQHAKGLTTGVTTAAQLRGALARARAVSTVVLVEEEVVGTEARLTLLDGALIGAMRYDPPSVTGDGRHTVRALIRALEARRSAGNADLAANRRLVLSDGVVAATLREQDLAFESVPAAGVPVLLSHDPLYSRGGLAVDITDDVHPGVVDLARRAAAALHLRFAGVDVIGELDRAPRGRTWVLEVNSHPEVMMHIGPDVGIPRDGYGPVLRALFPSLGR